MICIIFYPSPARRIKPRKTPNGVKKTKPKPNRNQLKIEPVKVPERLRYSFNVKQPPLGSIFYVELWG